MIFRSKCSAAAFQRGIFAAQFVPNQPRREAAALHLNLVAAEGAYFWRERFQHFFGDGFSGGMVCVLYQGLPWGQTA